ncbi:WcbI family polysaccharide biosynthesis putative acetyltransferase [Corynebacterium auriscanis]|uniref:WcbI family polysaccharide biosynthesis putative acetyltransferase n=1 Tax=Corynebacterium auriscanis TaxID=99807 RepID=UPI003CF6562C
MPTLTVIGNCQAESLRKLLMSTGHFESHRIPPVHELTTADMPWFGELLKGSDVVVAQPIRDDYRGLPVGTAQAFATAPPHAQQVVVPVLRFDGLMPYQAIIRDPDDSSLNPPVVPYHDLRILVAAAASSGESVAAGAANVLGRAVTPAALYRNVEPEALHRNVEPEALRRNVGPAALRHAAAMSVQQIRNREKRHDTVVISNFLETNPVWHTVNHPNNETLCVLARGVLRTLGLPTESITAPDYEMLGELDAPIEPESADALGVDPTAVAGRESWKTRNGGVLDEEQIVREQLEFYRQRPRLVAHGLQRHADRIENLGLLA